MRLFTFFILSMAFLQAQAYQRHKFDYWLPYYEYIWRERSEACQTDLYIYYANIRKNVTAPCAAVVDCMLTNVSESVKSNMASADILLGLTPQILGLAGPTVGEMAILSTHSPGFTSLLSLSFPSRSIAGLFVSVDVAGLLSKPVARTTQTYFLWFDKRPAHVRRFIHAISYATAAGAVANNIYTSIYLDLRTASGWRCGVDYLPLAWSISGFLITLVEMLAIRMRVMPGTPQRRLLSWLWRQDECRLRPSILREAQDGCLTEVLFGIANFCSIVQTVLGTTILAGLLFISFLDALQIIMRYWASVAICSLLLRLELAGLRLRLKAT